MPDGLTLQALNKYKKYNLNYYPLEVVSRYHDIPLQEGAKLSYLFNLRPNICKPWLLNTYVIVILSPDKNKLKTTMVAFSGWRVNISTVNITDLRRVN